ncbi:unnamed protein product [Linum trigynum]|uniref:Retrotransposon Copia-like N-terminal domain-containing protein n=1 Tax=Linum trigynum TaxID=586398 RepID=A0AAV2GU69_9ROSI
MSSGDEKEQPSKLKSGGAGGSMNPPTLPPHLILHYSDSPNSQFVGELLNDVNYSEWVVDITDSLIAKNKLCFVDGTLPPPQGSAETEALRQCNTMVKGWLKSYMTKEVRGNVRFATTAREIWVDLQSHFGHDSAPRIYELKSTIISLQQEKSSVHGKGNRTGHHTGFLSGMVFCGTTVVQPFCTGKYRFSLLIEK